MYMPRRVQNLVANFRNLPEDQTRSLDRGEKPLGNLIEVIRKQYDFGHESLERVIMENWSSVVGAHRAHRCSPERIRNQRELVIFVSTAVLKQEIDFDKRRILRKLQSLPGCSAIDKLVLRLG